MRYSLPTSTGFARRISERTIQRYVAHVTEDVQIQSLWWAKHSSHLQIKGNRRSFSSLVKCFFMPCHQCSIIQHHPRHSLNCFVVCDVWHVLTPPLKTNMAMENPPWMKMYFLLDIVIFRLAMLVFRVHISACWYVWSWVELRNLRNHRALPELAGEHEP